MSVVEAVRADIEKLGAGGQGSGLAATALALAAELDARNSATSKSMCAKSLIDVMRELRALAPPAESEDDLERARKRREDRLARQSATGAAPPS